MSCSNLQKLFLYVIPIANIKYLLSFPMYSESMINVYILH